jgi:hypothetical protein
MKKVLSFIPVLILMPVILMCENREDLYRKADYVAHIRVVGELVPSGFTSDLGTTWYQVSFMPLEVHKNRDTTQISSFWFVHSGYDVPDPEWFKAGQEWIVFLTFTGFSEYPDSIKIPVWEFREPSLMQEGKLPFDLRVNREIRQLRNATPFDRAVTANDFTQVEQIISGQVQMVSIRHGGDMYQAVGEMKHWLKSFSTVDAVEGDSCATHILIYPGWYDLGLRFLTGRGPEEYTLTLSLGKVVNLYFLRYILRRAGDINRLFFKSFRPTPGIIEQIHQTCVREEFQHKQSWMPQDSVEISLTCLQDTIWIIPGQMPAIRVKVKFLNTSNEVKYILWPAHQTRGFKQMSIRLYDEEGNVLEEEELFPLQQEYGSADAERIGLLPGDSLVGYHSINDFYGAFTDATANHFFPWFYETRYIMSLIYSPKFDGDSSLNWIPEGGSREVFHHLSLPAIFTQHPSDEVTITARLISKEGYYVNNFGQTCSYDGMVEVIGNLQGDRFRYSDTLAFRFPYNMYDRTIAQPHPALDFNLMETGDLLQLDINTFHPADTIMQENFIGIPNVLLANRPDALRIIRL